VGGMELAFDRARPAGLSLLGLESSTADGAVHGWCRTVAADEDSGQ
jgi:hypothetical protein